MIKPTFLNQSYKSSVNVLTSADWQRKRRTYFADVRGFWLHKIVRLNDHLNLFSRKLKGI